MKRINAIIAILLIAAMAFAAAACTSPKPQPQGPGDNGTVKVTPEPAEGNVLPDPGLNLIDVAPLSDREKLDSLTEFYRFGTSEGLPSETMIITSSKEFEQKVLPLLADDTYKAAAQAAAAKYNDDFFKNNRLVVFRIDLSSGSFTPQVQYLTCEKGVVDVTVGFNKPEGDVFTADMAYYLGFLILDTNIYGSNSTVNVHGALVEGKTSES